MSEIRAGREEELLRIATRLFKEKGYHNTSMQDLADAFGVQKASLYYYIDSKEELLRRLMERAIAILGTHIDEIYATDLPPVEKLRQALEHHAVTLMDHLNLVSVYLYEYRNLPEDRLHDALAVRRHYEQVLCRIVEDGIERGELRPVDVRLAVFGLLGMLNWTHQWYSPRGELSSRQIAAILVDMALFGLVTRA
jgi:AcrR family transcriptional regulator